MNSARAMFAIAVVAALALIVFSVAIHDPLSNTGISRVVGRMFVSYARPIDTHYIIEGGVPTEVRADDARLRDAAIPAASVMLHRPVWRGTGLWATTESTRVFNLIVMPESEACSDGAIAMIRSHVVAGINAAKYGLTPADITTLSNGMLVQTRVVWMGYLYNLVSVVLLAAFLTALALAIADATRAKPGRARIGAATCPNCCYPRAGLDASAPCPECGAKTLSSRGR